MISTIITQYHDKIKNKKINNGKMKKKMQINNNKLKLKQKQKKKTNNDNDEEKELKPSLVIMYLLVKIPCLY